MGQGCCYCQEWRLRGRLSTGPVASCAVSLRPSGAWPLAPPTVGPTLSRLTRTNLNEASLKFLPLRRERRCALSSGPPCLEGIMTMIWGVRGLDGLHRPIASSDADSGG